MDRDEVVARIRTFLARIGIATREGMVTAPTFLPGLRIERGEVWVDLALLTYPGDMLHEAGHVALAPPSQRAQLSQEILGDRPAHESEEIGVLLWTFLAAKEIGLPSEAVFHAGGYKGEASWLTEQFETGTLIGLPLLVWMGIAETDSAGVVGVRSWLRTTEP